MVFDVTPRTNTKKTCVQKRLNYVLRYDNHSKFNSQHYYYYYYYLNLIFLGAYMTI